MHTKLLLIHASESINPKLLPPSYPNHVLPPATAGIQRILKTRELLHKNGLGSTPTAAFYSPASRSEVSLALIGVGLSMPMEQLHELSIPEPIRLSQGTSLEKFIESKNARDLARKLHIDLMRRLRMIFGRTKLIQTAVVVGHDVLLNLIALNHCKVGDHKLLRETELKPGEYFEVAKLDDGDELIGYYDETGQKAGSVYRASTKNTEQYIREEA
jgi:hypothetical protein